jgi:NADH dehydrogenase FAD-containing subunit
MMRVLLAGGGHTHLIAGPLLARRLGSAAGVTLLASSEKLLYSGMMPGWLAGHYEFEACAIDLKQLAQAHGLQWTMATLVDIDFAARQVIDSQGQRHDYDLLSLNVGSASRPGLRAAGSSVTTLPAKPFAEFVQAWDAWLDRAPSQPRCFVVGGGAAGFELACALASLRSGDGPMAGASVSLVTSDTRLLAGQSRLAATLARTSLHRKGVQIHDACRYVGVDGNQIRLMRHPDVELALDADLVLIATGAHPPDWLRACAARQGIRQGADGGIAVDSGMRSLSDHRVFASGDCASFVEQAVPRSGVHALRQGEPLSAAIAQCVAGGPDAARVDPLARYTPQRHALALLNRCDGTAIAQWGPLAWAGRAAWQWKDRIDRGFMARFEQR